MLSIPRLTCLRCQHTWVPRKERVNQCPACHSALWDQPSTDPPYTYKEGPYVHKHKWLRSRPTATAETCERCNAWRHTEHAGPAIIAQEETPS